ncbi:tetrahydrofolate synthase [Aspergillus clavatus NRRL 1]|uniref:Folylpolyglutamate synthase n=1 Tax=Aspergillus clavatus (strain ATCC 1007 / CBS 513.65 / DSM 816 / NCTC 3887 / NRRL 1 / QM 1276 / 107) TaxID=344612 RepID=A1CHB8_ASPCL|nr:tetrahydrofolylpolyglutamate synthase (Met7), putative [Aspergillus clavatus NRRL 1]EAW10273.1 tetrahydrofolylpolyglutamate synthase (Met7), putative [Aspergillus clavatus NRRL 1]
MARNYDAAISALNSLQSNFTIIQEVNKDRKNMNLRSIPEMIEWLRRIGYKSSDLNRLNPVHIAGTKGKGSTSAFVSSILSQYTASQSPELEQSSRKLSKIGLFTSPHLRFARERITIDNTPLSEEKFAQYFFEVWDRLEESARVAGEDAASLQTKPQYFRYLTLMAFHAYLSEGVDAAVIECGIGGEYDSTNVIEQPIVSAITSLGIDHTALLGNTVDEIAWHKGGIIKSGAKAFSAPQPASAEEVLRKRAQEKGTQLQVVPRHPDLRADGDIKLGLAGDFQYTNASLATAAAAEFLSKLGIENIPADFMEKPLPPKFRKGLELARLGGRCETRRERDVTWYIDGGHTLESIKLAGQWFASQIQLNSSSTVAAEKKLRLLIFNQQTRDSNALAQALHDTLSAALGSEKPFTHAIFCTNVTYKDAGYRPDLVSINTDASDVERLRVQNSLAAKWNEIDPEAEVRVFGTIEEAVEFARTLANEERGRIGNDEAPVMTFVTGSLHLVGGFLDVIETKPGPQ